MKPMPPFISQCLGCAAALALAACSSAPIQFYTLVKPAAAGATATQPPLQIVVLPVSVPAQVDLPQLVVRESSSRIALIEDQQWIAPLGQEIRSALASELVAMLGAEDVSGAPRNKGLKPYRIKLEVRRFESLLGRSAAIEALWTLSAPQREVPSAVCSSRVEEPVGKGYAALVEGHQRALAQIAAQIAASLRAAQDHATAPHCPA